MIDFACKTFSLEEVIKCGLGLTRADYKLLLYFIDNKDWLTTADISKELSLNLSTVQRGVKRLYEKEVLLRSQENLDNGGYLFLYKAKEKVEKHLSNLMEDVAPTLTKVAGERLGAMLIDKAGSLKNLASMTSSKIQVMGAEKALFKHMKTGSKAPKHGLIFLHESVQKDKNKGKAARKLSSEISKAARIDFFRENPS